MALRRSRDAVRPMQSGVEPLRRVGRADLTREHRAHLVVVDLRVVLGVEVAVLPAPVGPAAGHPIEDLTRIALGAELLVARQRLERRLVGSGALQPLRHAVLGDAGGRFGNPRLAAILLRENVDGDLTPGRRDHDVLCLENNRAVGVDDSRAPRLESHAGIGIAGGGIGTRKLHRRLLVVSNTCSHPNDSTAPMLDTYCVTSSGLPQDIGVAAEFLVGGLWQSADIGG